MQSVLQEQVLALLPTLRARGHQHVCFSPRKRCQLPAASLQSLRIVGATSDLCPWAWHPLPRSPWRLPSTPTPFHFLNPRPSHIHLRTAIYPQIPVFLVFPEMCPSLSAIQSLHTLPDFCMAASFLFIILPHLKCPPPQRVF